ncbi:MAG: hypothetical protein AAFW89_14880 [Bacteroidota bacterium]
MESLALQKKDAAKTCDFCNAEEGKVRHIGEYVVKLTPVQVRNKEKLACQSCLYKSSRIRTATIAGNANVISSPNNKPRHNYTPHIRTFVVTIQLNIPTFKISLFQKK